MEVLLPEHLAKQLAQVRRAVANKKTCKLIQCKRSGFTEAKPKTVDKKEPKGEGDSLQLSAKIDEDKESKREPEIPEVKTKPAEKKTPKTTTEIAEKKTAKTTTEFASKKTPKTTTEAAKKTSKPTKTTTPKSPPKKNQTQANPKNVTESYFNFLF